MKKKNDQIEALGTEDETVSSSASDSAGLSPIVGISSKALFNMILKTTNQVVTKPLLTSKHYVGLMSKWSGIVLGDNKLNPQAGDRRFTSESWKGNWFYERVLQGYLSFEESLDEWIDELELDEVEERQIRFVTGALSSVVSPANYLLTNPQAVNATVEQNGANLLRGAKNFGLDAVHNGFMPSQVDKSQFRVGENLATSKGSVVFRNDILEIIQYRPTTNTVHEIPVMVVPPQINKFYVFDLTEDKSMFKFLLDQSVQLFAVSWKNPTAENRDWGMNEYIAALNEAVEAITVITGQPSINLVGACSGGITASILTGYFDAKANSAINSLTLLVSVLAQRREDSDVTVFAHPLSIEQAKKRSRKKGILSGEELSRVFNWMRPNELIWNYVVNNYLLGNQPPAFDILYWNNDTTNLPAKLHGDFIDFMQSNSLLTPGDISILNEPIDITAPSCDKYIVAGTTDHITPWMACYRSTQVLSGKIRFILSNSGHIQSLLNPPSNLRSVYYSNDTYPASPEKWLKNADKNQGSWWTDWSVWLSTRSGEKKDAAESLGNELYPAKEDAPGTYIR